MSNKPYIKDQRDLIETLRAKGLDIEQIAAQTGISAERVARVFDAQDKLR